MSTPKKVDGLYHFTGFPEFRPNLSPRDMFKAGIFGGTYFRPIHSGVTKKNYKNVHSEFPEIWFSGLDIDTEVISSKFDFSINKYEVKSGTSLQYWEKQGWIKAQDPYGWVQWYLRFFNGRRSPDDERQIDRWLKGVGPNGRFRLRLINMIKKGAGTTKLRSRISDYTISPVIRQLMLQWAYELTEDDFK